MKSLNLKTVIAFTVFLAVAGYFLWQEHSAHIALAVPYLPYLLILLCPLMHVFMHHGHAHGHGEGAERDTRQTDSDREPSGQASTAHEPQHGSLPKKARRHD